MPYKNRKNLYNLLFIAILLGFIISLAGCNWLSFGLLNIIDPQAQIRVDYRLDNLTAQGTAGIWFTIFSLNEAEFIGEQFSFEYYVDGVKIPELTRTIGATFYVPPSPLSSFENPVRVPKIEPEVFPVYFQDVIDYMNLHPTIVELDATITVMGTDGAGHSISKTITFDLPAILPGIDFTPPKAFFVVTPGTTGTAPFTVVFDASGSYDNEAGDALIRIASYSWDFGDGTTGTEMTENHTYNNPGAYSVILTVTDFYGNTGYGTVTIIANEPEAPEAVITTTPAADVSGAVTGSAPFEVYFNAYKSSSPESDSGVTIVSYSWDFGDGTTSTGITRSHTYSNIGTYTAILTVTDSNGKKGYDSVDIKVEKAPKAEITTTPASANGTAPFTVYFDAYKSTSESGIVSYEWNFGDGSSGGTGITVNHTYSTVGTYTVILTITDSNGFEAYDSVIVAVGDFESEASEATVVLTANPPTISAGSSSAITANCTDDSGNAVPNGTYVGFGTVGGGTLTVYASGLTTDGIANASLKIDIASTVTVVATTSYAAGSVIVTCE